MEKTKILFLTGHYGVGGKERQLTEMIKNLPTRYEVYLATKSSDGYYLDEIRNKLASYYTLDAKRFSVKSLSKVNKIIKEAKPDIVYSWSTTMSHLVLILNFFSKKKIKLINGSIRNAPYIKSIVESIETILYNFYPYVVSNSETGLKVYNQLGKKGRHVLTNGVDFSKFEKVNKGEARTKLEVNPTTFLVSMIARLEKEKDYINFIEVAKKVVEKNKQFLFLIVGGGYRMDELISLVEKNNLKNFVKLMGVSDSVEEIIVASDVTMLLSTTGESLSNSIIESLSAGVPVIASDLPGNRAVLRDGFNGYLVKNNDYKRISNILNRLSTNRKLTDTLGVNAKKHARENFSINKMVIKFEEIVKECTTLN